MDYIKICKWDDFQHYKKRNPPWIKLHTSLLDNEAFECLHNDSKVLLMCLWLFAARKGNGEIPSNIDYLQRKLPAGKKINLQPLIDNGFIEVYHNDSIVQATNDSTVLCSDRGRGRAKTEAKAETEKLKYLDFVFLSSDEYKKLIAKFGEQTTKDKIEVLNNYVGSKGAKYKSHYHTILNWERMDTKAKPLTTTEKRVKFENEEEERRKEREAQKCSN